MMLEKGDNLIFIINPEERTELFGKI